VVNVKNVSLGKVKTEKIILKSQKKAFIIVLRDIEMPK